MSQIYVTDNKAVVGFETGRLTIKSPDGMLRSLPIENIDGLTIFGNAQVSTQCIGECLRMGISLQYYSPKGKYYGKLSSTKHVNTGRQRGQVKLSENEEFSLAFTKKILKAKMHNQIVLLRRYERTSEVFVEDEITFMKALEKNIERATTISEAMGYEGSAARTYFSGLSKLINVKEFAFSGRNRRPPKDPFNSMLSFGYSIIMNEVYGAIEGRGLSPYFGFMHQDREKHPTLASDLMEEWRPVLVDSMVMALVNGHEVNIDNFTKDEETGGIFFDKTAMKTFINKMEKRLSVNMKYLSYINYGVSFRKAIDLQVLQLCKAIEEENVENYIPVIIR